MSAADEAGVLLGSFPADIVEITAQRGRASELESLALARGARLAPLGGCAATPGQLALGARPERWLLLTSPARADAAAALWREACLGLAAAVDLSSALVAFHLAGSAARAVLARGCRLDLHPDAFPERRVAATLIAQVPVILASLPAGWLLLAPATTARHFHEWLASVAKPFGIRPETEATIEVLFTEIG